MKTFLPVLTVLVCAAALSPRVSAQGPAAPMTPCASVTEFQVVCGQQGPEDLVLLPGARWLIASAMSGTGGINVIRIADRTTVRAYPTANAAQRFDAKTYAGCPGPPDASKFTTHGLWLETGRRGVSRLFAVGHGAREAIEVFEVDARGTGTPMLTWIGCAVAPDPIGLNSVRGLPDGGFIASNFLARNASAAERNALFAGQNNGELWEWHTASGWQKVPGSEVSGANGLEMSADGKWLYVAMWGSRSFMRLSRGRTPVERKEVPLGFRVDNIRRQTDGTLLATGQGQQSTDIVRVDPTTLAVTTLVHRADDAAFRSGTVAILLGDRYWVGSFGGDRIALLPAR